MHRLWIKAAIASSILVGSAAVAQNYVCVVDQLPMMFTGATRFEFGVMLREYRCARGHKVWG